MFTLIGRDLLCQLLFRIWYIRSLFFGLRTPPELAFELFVLFDDFVRWPEYLPANTISCILLYSKSGKGLLSSWCGIEIDFCSNGKCLCEDSKRFRERCPLTYDLVWNQSVVPSKAAPAFPVSPLPFVGVEKSISKTESFCTVQRHELSNGSDLQGLRLGTTEWLYPSKIKHCGLNSTLKIMPCIGVSYDL